MSSFFTTPASQKKRKRPQSSGDRSKGGSNKLRRRDDDISLSGSDVSDQDDVFAISGEEDDSEDEDGKEDAAERRIRLAEQYLATLDKKLWMRLDSMLQISIKRICGGGLVRD
ncbi:hypothetical protein MRB53_040161 [Persea americana]|nr:hypothetical protein MRB53_040161 [Persea americana]